MLRITVAVAAILARTLPATATPLGGAVPIWSSNATAQFVLLRRPFTLPPSTSPLQQAVLHISAQPIPNRLAGPRHGGSLASKLLCAYKLWVNGVPVGAGPGQSTLPLATDNLLEDTDGLEEVCVCVGGGAATHTQPLDAVALLPLLLLTSALFLVTSSHAEGRPTGANSTRENPALLYDSYQVAGLLRPGAENVVAVEAFYWTAAQESVEVGCPPGEASVRNPP